MNNKGLQKQEKKKKKKAKLKIVGGMIAYVTPRVGRPSSYTDRVRLKNPLAKILQVIIPSKTNITYNRHFALVFLLG